MYSVSWQAKNLGSGQVKVISLRKEGKSCVHIDCLSEALYVWVVKMCVCVYVCVFLGDFEILNNNLKH